MKQYPLYSHPNLTNFCQLLDWNATNYPSCVAFQYRDGKDIASVTYAQFRDDVDVLASFFLRSGFLGCKIAVIGENSYSWIVTYFAVVLSGNIIVPLDKELPGEDIVTLLTRCGATALVHSDAYADTAAEMLRENRIGTNFNMKDIPSLLASGQGTVQHTETDESAVCTLLFTSGTTGEPKGVMLTQSNLIADTIGSCQLAEVTGPTLLTLPLHHAFAFTTSVLAMLVYHVPICISKSLRNFTRDMKDFHPENMFLVPLYVETIYKNIWKIAKKQGKERQLKALIAVSNALRRVGIDLRHKLFHSILEQFGGELDQIICGGAALKQSYIDGLDGLGIQVLNGYGITECSPVVAVNRNKYFRAGSIGLPLPCCEVKIQDGEICVKGENVMAGYESDSFVSEDGWFKTGDLGYLDKDGFLFITGRKKNLIILSNGKNVAPEELEEKLLDINGVQEAVVYAEDGVITAEIFAERETGIQESIMSLNKQLPGYKRIQKVRFRDTEFEKTTTKKIKR